MDIQAIAELAKKGARLDSTQQWVLADELANLLPREITQVAAAAGRNEDTLLQYQRAAQRWPKAMRVEGVSFSAHRVVLSWHDPVALLMSLKAKYGSPTVKQVRQAMGLEGHPAVELLHKGIKKIDTDLNMDTLDEIIDKLVDERLRISDIQHVQEELVNERLRIVADLKDLADNDLDDIADEEYKEVPVEEPVAKWKPPVRTSDVVGL